MSTGASAGKTSAYVARLRRAFLLRVHPDQFRRQSESVRREQATLVQALSDRMAEQDFLAYTASSSKVNAPSPLHQFRPEGKSPAYLEYPFSIEQKDGTVSKLSIQLADSSPHQILEQLAASIDFPPPPPEPQCATDYPEQSAIQGDVNQFIQSCGYFGSFPGRLNDNSHAASKDRNVLHFLKNTNFEHIKQRKLDRINVTAAAMVARREFHFSAVDGTGLGWSSASLAICISRLTSLHEEHRSKLNKSFYPFRLVFSSDEFHRKIDLFGGIVRLNPAATSLQWLNTLCEVNVESIDALKRNQTTLQHNLTTVQHALRLKVAKGHTCQPEEYHRCLDRLSRHIRQTPIAADERYSLIVPNKAKLVVESDLACRRGKVRKDGSFQVGAGMGLNQIRNVLSTFAGRSSERLRIEAENQSRRREVVSRIMYAFGVQRVREAGPAVTSDQISECLLRLLGKDEEEKEALRGYLAGQSIGVAGRGHLCHIGDDGSVVIPANCS